MPKLSTEARLKNPLSRRNLEKILKGTSVFASDFSALLCLLQLNTRSYLSDYRNFLTQKDGSLLINTFASNNSFSDRNIFQKGVDTLSKIDYAFLTKSWRFQPVRIIRLCSNFASLWYKHLLWNYKKNMQTSDVSICNSNKKYPIGTITFYTNFCVQALACFHCCC